MGGKFILRIEDTDLARSKKEYLDEILNSVKWLGMDWDELYYQSQRFDIYKEYAQKLIDSGKACQKDGAVFFKYDFTSVKFNDLIRGEVIFNELPKEEEVIVKSDGSPTYNFCCVIDDALLEINCVIRGEDHISNTPKQLLMYQALGLSIPDFAHVPLILSPDGGRLSKRHGATAISEYRALGYLPEALANYLMLLSWSPGDNREIISLNEARGIFDIKNVNKTGAAFNLDKLKWINAGYIKTKSPKDLEDLAYEYLTGKNFLPAGTSKEYVGKVAFLLRERVATLGDILDSGRFCFYDDYAYAEDTAPILAKNMAKEINALGEKLTAMSDFGVAAIEKEFRAVCEAAGIKAKELVHPVRVALCGRRNGPGLFETMEVLGKDAVIKRLERLTQYWGSVTK